jgi:hypothetical protein
MSRSNHAHPNHGHSIRPKYGCLKTHRLKIRLRPKIRRHESRRHHHSRRLRHVVQTPLKRTAELLEETGWRAACSTSYQPDNLTGGDTHFLRLLVGPKGYRNECKTA